MLSKHVPFFLKRYALYIGAVGRRKKDDRFTTYGLFLKQNGPRVYFLGGWGEERR